jgi:hypothetical protein
MSGKLLAEAAYWRNCAQAKPSSFELATPWDIFNYCADVVEREARSTLGGGEARDWRAMLVSLIGQMEPFEGGRDGDQCLWCHWDRDRKIDSWQASQKREFHAEDCEFALAIDALAGAQNAIEEG